VPRPRKIIKMSGTQATLNHLFKGQGKAGNNQYRTSKVLVGLDLVTGLEFGDNLKNDFNMVNSSPSQGSGGFLRGVPQATGYLVVPNVLGLKKINPFLHTQQEYRRRLNCFLRRADTLMNLFHCSRQIRGNILKTIYSSC
jgi:hypothetical protein